jgi:hypothetical protein
MNEKQTIAADSRIFGLYRDFATLRAAVANLTALCYSNDDISVFFPEAAVSKNFLANNDSGTPANDPAAFIGGTLASLAYVRPESVGVVSAALADLGVPDCEAELYESSLRQGHLLVCVRSSAESSVATTMNAIALVGAEHVIAVRASSRRKRTESLDLDLALLAGRLPANAWLS